MKLKSRRPKLHVERSIKAPRKPAKKSQKLRQGDIVTGEYLAYVSVQTGQTFTENYHSVKFSVDVHIPVAIPDPYREGEDFDRDAIDEAIRKALEIASEHYEREAEELKKALGID